jgi:outer membrane protein
MIYKRIKILVMFFLLLNAGVNAQQKINIQQLLQHALENSYDIKEASLNVDKSVEVKKEAISGGLPQISGKVKYEQFINQPVIILPGSLMAALTAPPAGAGQAQGQNQMQGVPPTGFPDIVADYGKPHNMDIGIQFSQLLFSMQYINGVKTAAKAQELYEMSGLLSERDLIYVIYHNYYSLLSIYKNIEIIDNNISSLSQLRDITQLLVEADLTLNTDLSRIAINISNLETAKKQAFSGIEIQTNNLKMLAGFKRQQAIEIEVSDLEHNYDLSAIKLPGNPDFNSITNNLIEVKLLNKQIELNELQIKTQKGTYTPTIAAYGSFIKQTQENNFNMFSNNGTWRNLSLVGITTNIPIFSGRKNKAKVNQAKINRQITINQKEKAIEGLNLEYLNAKSEFNISLLNSHTQYKNIELAKEIMNQQQLKYKEGLSGLTDVLLADTELRQIESKYIQNMTNLKLSELKLIKAQGRLNTLIQN